MTRAIQIEFLLDGVVNPTSSEYVASGTAYFYSAGTTDPKNVWTEKEKTNAYTSYSLNGIGAIQLYGEGNYKIVIKDSDGATVQTLDNIRLEYPYYGIRTITAGTTAMLSEDDFILCNTTGGAITINALAAASWTRPLKIQRISGANNITFDPDGSETIDGSATLTISSDAIVEIISDGSNLRTAGFRSSFEDTDNDTKIQVEESADDDTIRFDAAGSEIVTIDSSGLHVGTSYVIEAKSIEDADNDTKVQVEESADEDKVRIDTGGTERLVIDSTGAELKTGNLIVTNGYIEANAIEDSDNDTKVQVEESVDEDKVRIDCGGTERAVFDTQSTFIGELEADSLDINGVGDISDTLTLSKSSGNGLVVTSDADFNGNIDVDGTANLDNTDIDGTLNLNGTDLSATFAEINTIADGLYLPLFSYSRPIFAYSTTYTITVGAGYYYVKDKVAQWTSNLTSRALTADIGSPGADTLYYLYLDYSAITSLTAITNTELIWSATAPSYSHTYAGWYNGDDRCIFAVLTNGTPDDIVEFDQFGDLIAYVDSISDRSAATQDDSFSGNGTTLTIPAFTRKALAILISQHSTTGNWTVFWSGNSGSSSGHMFNYGGPAETLIKYNAQPVGTDPSQIIYTRCSPSHYATIGINTSGWYFSQGM